MQTLGIPLVSGIRMRNKQKASIGILLFLLLAAVVAISTYGTEIDKDVDRTTQQSASGTSSATAAPTPPWKGMEEDYVSRGAKEGKKAYIKILGSQIKRLAELQNDASLKGYAERCTLMRAICQYVGSWAYADAQKGRRISAVACHQLYTPANP